MILQNLRLFATVVFWLSFIGLQAQETVWQTPFESQENYTATYEEVIDFYKQLAQAFPRKMRLVERGPTDSGHPLHTVVLSHDGDFDPVSLRQKNRLVLLINNAIHAGEPCGVDATMLLFRDYLVGDSLPENVVLVAIPFYNIGGGLNRGSFSRTNQNGPESHGFRGNAKNLDLNRDFVKSDSRNARSFQEIFTTWRPHFFVDNHTSNGADYQYTITLIPTQKDKLAPPLAGYLTKELLPELFSKMATTPYEMTPYVYARNTPDDGIYGFLDLPRYSTGYAALRHSIGFMPETHMLKPFADRVRSVYHFMDFLVEKIDREPVRILAAFERNRQQVLQQERFDLKWTVDESRVDSTFFRGYTADYKPSAVTGQQRLYYDRDRPWTRNIPFWNSYKATKTVRRPFAYVIPQAYVEVVENLRRSGVELYRLERDVQLTGTFYYIDDYESRSAPYEGHYLHSEVVVRPETLIEEFRAGDYLVLAAQPEAKFLVHVLEPEAPDSYFAWNYFDGVLMQKEYFSSYVFEERAAELLQQDAELKRAFEERRTSDAKFAKDGRAQLQFIYEHSPHYERTHNRYPVLRLETPIDLPLVKE